MNVGPMQLGLSWVAHYCLFEGPIWATFGQYYCHNPQSPDQLLQHTTFPTILSGYLLFTLNYYHTCLQSASKGPP